MVWPLEDGNAGKEAEELIPGPNFCVLMVVQRKKMRRFDVGYIPTSNSALAPFR